MNHFCRPLVTAILLLVATLYGADAQTITGLTKVVERGMAAPGGNGTFSSFGTPCIDGDSVAFQSSVLTPLALITGVYKSSDGEFTRIVDNTMSLPGKISDNDVELYGVTFSEGTAAFVAKYESGMGVFTGSGGGVSMLANLDTPIPLAPGSRDFDEFGPLLSIHGGLTVFDGGDTLVPPGVSISGLYSGAQGGLSRLMDSTFAIPNGTGTFITINQASQSEAGTAFRGAGSGTQQGIYVFNGGGITRIADKGTAVPSGTGTFTVFGAPIRKGLRTAFRGEGPNGQAGFYMHDGSTLMRLVDRNTPAPSGFGTLGPGALMGMGSNGEILFSATFSSILGLYLHTPATGTTALVMRNGARIDGRGVINFITAGREALSGRKLLANLSLTNAVPAMFKGDFSSFAKGSNGTWDTPANWTFNEVPRASSSVLISTAATALTVTGPAAPDLVRGLSLMGFNSSLATLQLQSGGPVMATEGVVVERSSALSGNGSIMAGAGKDVAIRGAVIAPGVNGIGAITVGSASIPTRLLLEDDSNPHIDLRENGQCDTIHVHGDVILGQFTPRITFNVLDDVSGSDYVFLTYTGARTGTFRFTDEVPDGYTLDYSTAGRVVLKAPPPGPDNDLDDDTIPDDWELDHALDLQTLTISGDFDHDGATDAQEYIADTDPLDPSEILQVVDFNITPVYETNEDDEEVPTGEMELSFTWTSSENCLYRIEVAESLSGEWETVEEDIFPEDGGTTSWGVVTEGRRTFLRVTSYRPE